MLIFAHRGASGYAPENTLAAMDKAIELNAEAVEIDIHANNGELFVFHDRYLDKLTSRHGLIHHIPQTELRSLQVQGQPIPTLFEVLSCLSGHCKVNIELKGLTCLRPLLKFYPQIFNELGYQQQDIIFSSFQHQFLHTLKQRYPDALVAPLLASMPLCGAQVVSDLQAYSLHLNINIINQDIVDDAHSRGAKVYVYTVDNEGDIKALQCMGVDGIFSNYPDKAKAALLQPQEVQHAATLYQDWFG
ncbi:glycerophosphodiester phosphodiesterase [Shewanella gelidii]|uniref:Glycerophosphoryl diester phosphodiesterase n=1 Tax=Shewanella gelidii TaxID=1642821 RepID=A0A917JP35_9GAMM|nr:glycerophosphodiester phosphodiesterase family protein [Shewanella gelidii]MCL1097732.1 glycerophosphodiester phosphodiesterase [Shewanella gelidii]GGI79219.1 glycerophosphoryl diester phosphodiesterase [Shewanella gelidii]